MLQRLALSAYRMINRTGVLRTRPGRRFFEATYDFYKTRFEAAALGPLCEVIPRGSTVIDVGANIGVFTLAFARAVGPAGRVVAIEPETKNFARLRARLEGAGLDGRVTFLQAAAAERDGTLHLRVNPDHPGDHRLGADGLEVAAVTLDRVVGDLGWPEVSLIKIDVQGAEQRVIDGSEQLLRRLRPLLFVEIDPSALAAMGSDASSLLRGLGRLGYVASTVDRSGVGDPVSVEEAIADTQRSETYRDLLLRPAPAPAP